MLSQVLGKYELRREVGRGAMGEVFEAWDTDLHRAVAIKLLTRELTREAQERFRREARAVAALDHPNIVRLYDLGEHDGRRFLVMQLLDGRTVADEISANVERRIVSKVRFAADICSALSMAHQAGIVHRDVKPANLHLGKDGVIRLVDFGIAHLAGSDLTVSSDVLGTPAYLAPEALSGHDLDGRADLYSLAATLYEWISGRRPFVAGDVQALFRCILNESPPPLRCYSPECPPLLAACIHRCLSKDVAHRPADALAFSRELLGALPSDQVAIVENDATTIIIEPASRTAPRRVALLAAALVALVSVGGLLMWQGGEPPSPGTSGAMEPATTTPTPAAPAPVTSGRAQTAPARRPVPPPVDTAPAAVPAAPTALQPAPPLQPSDDEPEVELLPIGTPLLVAITEEIRTDRNRIGDRFHAELRAPLLQGEREVAPAGTVVQGRIAAISGGSGTAPPSLELTLVAIEIDGDSVPIRTARYRVVPPEGQQGRKLLPLVIGASVGGVVGGVVGGKEGAAAGALAGAGLAASATQSEPQGSYVFGDRLTFKLAQAAVVQKKQ